ncbi:sugar ABC transporter permease [Suicoccus acidiformans]|uniref:Sugar ABC transporter permease n=1 Tax=Suicoccus acidiformans TaxID=2036206 RepID=A0A347WM75_9LACT|nr:sugar ABC transporter permease [Suicoccus acidiformans]AXY26182.1 sugar ABC transporter permease [Suicoccus acidiformans]
MYAFGKKSSLRWGLALAAPTVIGLIILNIIPIFRTIYMSFFEVGAFGKSLTFVGFDNYKKLFQDEQILQATWNTLRYTLMFVPPTIVISLGLAVILNNKIAGRSIYRTIYFLPMVAAPAAVTMVWKWLFNRDFGLINYLLNQIGIESIAWIENPNVAPIAIAIIGIWSQIGYSMVLFLSGLQEIPKDYYEAADIDGASWWTKLWTITLPLLSPTIFFVSVTSIMTGMQVFDVIYMMVGPNMPSYDTTVSLVYLFYNNSFLYGQQGYGSTIVVYLVIILLILTYAQMKLQSRWVNYMGE